MFLHQDTVKKNEKTIFVVVLILLTWSQLARYGFSLLRDGFHPAEYLPFFICRISSLVLLYYVITKDKRVESFLFYWGATGLAGVIYPNGHISNIANLTETFYIDHFLLGLTPIYLVLFRGFKPNRKNLLQITFFMFVVLLIFIPINNNFGTDFFYTKNQSIFKIVFPNIPDTIYGVDVSFSSIIFVIVHTITAYFYFLGIYKLLAPVSVKRVV
jgi:hypothetical integral membrane protein (TIGR02206 family)